MQDLEIDLEIPVYEDVAKPGQAAKSRREVTGKRFDLGQHIDGAGVVWNIAPSSGRNMGRDIQSVLSAELETPFDGPPLV